MRGGRSTAFFQGPEVRLWRATGNAAFHPKSGASSLSKNPGEARQANCAQSTILINQSNSGEQEQPEGPAALQDQARATCHMTAQCTLFGFFMIALFLMFYIQCDRSEESVLRRYTAY